MNQNRLFVAYKPAYVGSNRFLGSIKRKYKVKKAGFSGTLDPFAKGVLIIAFGSYTKLFRFLKKAPKRYRAVLWLGAKSDTLDIEKITSIEKTNPSAKEQIQKTLKEFLGELEYLPPKYCAKKIEGKRAYELSRQGEEFELKTIKSEIYDIKLLNYSHPFISFETEVSEGTYIRSIGYLIAQKLGFEGCLSSLERINEGDFVYDKERAIDPLKMLNMEQNRYLGESDDILFGKKLDIMDFEVKKDGDYFLETKGNLSIINIKNEIVTYKINRIELC